MTEAGSGTGTGNGSGAFSAFWQKSVDKVGFKSVKFMPNATKVDGLGSSKKAAAKEAGGDEDGNAQDETSGMTQKQRRRAQVRKAQIEHRQRKENYVKHLEQDVIDLRDSIAKAEMESVVFRHENESIKATLQNAKVLAPPSASTSMPTTQPSADFMDYTTVDNQPSFNQGDFGTSNSPLDFGGWPTTSAEFGDEMLISATFDEWIDSTILQISPVNSHSSNATQTPHTQNQPSSDIDIYDFPSAYTHSQLSNNIVPSSTTNNAYYANQEALAGLNLELSPPQPTSITESHHASQSPPKRTTPPPIDLSTLALNFILALEHPCRTHFHPHPPTFLPTAPPTGHELMASTYLYAHLPSTSFTASTPANPFPIAPDNASWTAPSTALQLDNLLGLARSLPTDVGEITPVQGWFMLVGRYSVAELLGKELGAADGEGERLDRLKRALGKLVDCFSYGAVMDKGRFWEVVEDVLGEPRGVKGKGRA